MGTTVGQTYNFMLVFCDYSQVPTQLWPLDYAFWSLDLCSIFKCSQKYKNLQTQNSGNLAEVDEDPTTVASKGW